jgi:hypothetical protein
MCELTGTRRYQVGSDGCRAIIELSTFCRNCQQAMRTETAFGSIVPRLTHSAESCYNSLHEVRINHEPLDSQTRNALTLAAWKHF